MSWPEWPPEKAAELRRLWDDEHSTAEIGRLMGISKGSVIGKAARIGLTARANPSKPRVPRTIPILPSQAPIVAMFAEALKPEPKAPKPKRDYGPITSGVVIKCRWPMWPEQPPLTFCGDPSLRGRPYCADHCARAYRAVGSVEA